MPHEGSEMRKVFSARRRVRNGEAGFAMKQFAVTLAAALIGVSVALLLYDRFVVQPRATAHADALAKATEINLQKAHAEANTIASNLDASIDHSITDARQALDAQAGEQDKRR